MKNNLVPYIHKKNRNMSKPFYINFDVPPLNKDG
jgi:hypothetical protein